MAGSIQLLEPCWTPTNQRFGRVIYKYTNIDMFLYVCVFQKYIHSWFTYIHIQYVPYIHVGREPLKASFESSWWKSTVLFVTRPWYFCPCLKVDHYLNNSKMHPVTLKFRKKKRPFPFQGSLNYPFWGDPGFVDSFQIGLSEPFEAIFWGVLVSQGWKPLDLQAGAKTPRVPIRSVGFCILIHVKFQ